MREKYKLKYSCDADCRSEGYTKEDIETDHDGLCDAMIVISMLFNDDGSYSQCEMTADGRTGKQLSTIDIFRAWSMLGMGLSEDESFTGWQKHITQLHADTMRMALKEIGNLDETDRSSH